ncbi:phosphoenolpyruvate carboxykinase (ATP) [Spirosoma rigui]|uniref:hypothetical protein n=1 Tax=Spirosoma rigui TaxID=564064 RepID=UPI0012D2AC40|nr:hypothetical protein [Spirosoma rigui]
MNYYKLHHLVVASSLDFPELAETVACKADVVITEGNVPIHLPESETSKRGSLWENEVRYELNEDDILLTIDGVGRIVMSHNQWLVIEKYEYVDYATVRLYILGTCFGFFLLRQHIFPFHGSTICTQYGTAMFIGPSGWGKSTTAAKFLKEGHTLLSDDVCVVRLLENNKPYAYPSSHRVKLWDDSIDAIGYQHADYSAILPDWNKKQLFAHHNFPSEPHPLTVIYVLWPNDDDVLSLELLKSHEKLVALTSNTFRLEGIAMFGLQKEHFVFCSTIAQSVPVVRLRRPTSCFAINDLYELVMEDLRTNYHSQSCTETTFSGGELNTVN